ncbi:MAG: hypothetical protein M1838_004872 [Thelocarpon superellum]|nr:MAG: hypothetical protein M1838_004872 [Thelocarpon superellum]
MVSLGQDAAHQVRTAVTSRTGQGVLKCSLGYLLGSMATFVTPISALLGNQDGKHIVATVTVYFHSARSLGSMFEATLLATLAVLYAVLISVASMSVAVGCRSVGLQVLGLAIVVVLFCGGGLGFVGWLKQRLSNPLVNVACSLTSLAIITVLTKEGAVQAYRFSAQKITQVIEMVLMGMFATAVVCVGVRPISARHELREAMIRTTDALGEMLATITRSFLEGREEEMQDPAFKQASQHYRAVLSSLTKHLREAKYEHFFFGTEREYHVEAKLVECMQSLAQSTGGLRSAAATQFTLLAQSTADHGQTMASSVASSALVTPRLSSDQLGMLTAIEEAPEEGHEELPTSLTRADGRSAMSTAADVFATFIEWQGPSMKSLAYTMKQILDELPFGPGPRYEIAVNAHFRSSLVDALDLYSHARAEALRRLYQERGHDRARTTSVAADHEEIAASCGHFSFSLQDFAEAMKTYLDTLEELKDEVAHASDRRSWNWLFRWRRSTWEAGKRNGHGDDQEDLIDLHDSHHSQQDDPTAHTRDTRASTSQCNQVSLSHPFRYRIWKFLEFLRRDDIRFAVKVGAGAALWALPSFIPSTRPFYSRWRGEWGLLSYMLVCSMTVGASNTTGVARFLGTSLGAIGAIVAWNVSPGNPYGLAVLGWLMSLFCFYVIVALGRGPMGRFILLTYNLSALYAYSLSVRDGEGDDDEGGASPDINEIAGDSAAIRRSLEEEARMRRCLYHLGQLRTAAASEFELRASFPETVFNRILESTRKMLDAFHAMNVVIQKDLTASAGEKRLLMYTMDERARLCIRLSHLFQVLASSMKLEYPLSDALPNTEHARDRLLAKISDYRAGAATAPDEDFALLYVYALVTGQLAEEIFKVAREIEGLFGMVDEDALKLE